MSKPNWQTVNAYDDNLCDAGGVHYALFRHDGYYWIAACPFDNPPAGNIFSGGTRCCKIGDETTETGPAGQQVTIYGDSVLVDNGDHLEPMDLSDYRELVAELA